jgi:hypothetical protein
MWRLGFAGDHADFDVLKSSALEKLVEIRFAEAEPAIGVKLAGFLHLVLKQVENRDAPAFLQDT